MALMNNFSQTILNSPWGSRALQFISFIFDPNAKKTYAQEGEDIILRRIFGTRRQGFFIDVGAHHPLRFSNTNLFYQMGWSGINIEPNPDLIRVFDKCRPRDINLGIGISNEPGMLTYYKFNEPALNTFDPQIAKARVNDDGYVLQAEITIPVHRLEDILNQFLPENQEIDFMTIDVEGLDLSVLESNNWERYRPRFVLAEVLGLDLEEVMRSELVTFMKTKQYALQYRTYNTLFFGRVDNQ